MSIYMISDIHVKMDGQNLEILKSFMSLPFEKGDELYLLGDIFDLLIGPHQEYKKLYKFFFQRIDELISLGVPIHYFEGNHDFHLEKLLQGHGVEVHKKPIVKKYFGKSVLFCHGDEIELGNLSYKIYKNFIQSRPLNVVANYVMPFKLLNLIGENASKKSRKRNKSRYGNSQENKKIRDSFRAAAKKASLIYGVEQVFCGHSHFKDDFTWDDKNYKNCGYLPYTKNYIVFDESGSYFKDIEI